MEKRFRLLIVFSILFKIIACATVLTMVIGLVGLFVGGKTQEVPLLPLALNMVVQLLVTALIFYALGEVIRILLVIEEQTRKP